MPQCENDWIKIADGFNSKWNFPNCIGALDGKHINIKAPRNAGSSYYNYKGHHSTVLMALADADYKFIYVNIGAKGRVSDGGVFNNTFFSDALSNEELHIPPPRSLPGRSTPVPFVIVADDAFSMRTNLLKPFSSRQQAGDVRIFNYRLSRARRIIENAFGIASACFRILRRTMEYKVENVNRIVAAICVLHNFLIERKSPIYAGPGSLDTENNGTLTLGQWRTETDTGDGATERDDRPLPNMARNISNDAKQIRLEFKEYFMNEGQVPWQYQMI